MSIELLGCNSPCPPTLICQKICIPDVSCETPFIPSCDPVSICIPSCDPVSICIPSCDPVSPCIPSCKIISCNGKTASKESSCKSGKTISMKNKSCPSTCSCESESSCSCESESSCSCESESSCQCSKSESSRPEFKLVNRVCLDFEYTTSQNRQQLLCHFRKLSDKLAKVDCKKYSFFEKKSCNWSGDFVDFFLPHLVLKESKCDASEVKGMDLTKLDSRFKLSVSTEVDFVSRGSCGPEHTSKGGLIMDVGQNRYGLLISNCKVYLLRRTILINQACCEEDNCNVLCKKCKSGKGSCCEEENKRCKKDRSFETVCNPPIMLCNLDCVKKRKCQWVKMKITWSQGKLRFYVDGSKIYTDKSKVYGPIMTGFSIITSDDTNEVKSALIPKSFELKLSKIKC